MYREECEDSFKTGKFVCLLEVGPGAMVGCPMLGGPCGGPVEAIPGCPGIMPCFCSLVFLFSSSSF